MNTPSPDPREERETRPAALVQLVVNESDNLYGAQDADEEREIMSRIHDYSSRYLGLGWQPIETAPKDGWAIVAVAVYDAHTNAFVRWDTWTADMSDDPEEESIYSGWRVVDASLWCPLLSPPSTRTETGGEDAA